MRYGIDALVAVEIACGRVSVSNGHQLVGPGRLRSDAMALLYSALRNNEITTAEARAARDALTTMKIRLLNDRVSRNRAWEIALANNWDEPAPAEDVAVTLLQADALVALDAHIVNGASGLVDIASVESLAK